MLPMTVQQYFPQAAEQVALVVGNAAPSTLDLPTPCADFSLHALLQHFFGTTTALARLGRREPLDDNDPYGAQVDWLGEGWQQRLAANVEQLHCQHPGCDVPGYLCHAHHQIPWSQGGGTDLRTTQLLCPFHHARAHQPGEDPMRT